MLTTLRLNHLDERLPIVYQGWSYAFDEKWRIEREALMQLFHIMIVV